MADARRTASTGGEEGSPNSTSINLDRLERLRRRVELYNSAAALGNSYFGTFGGEANKPQAARGPSSPPTFDEVDDDDDALPPPPPPHERKTKLQGPAAAVLSSSEFDPVPLTNGGRSSSKGEEGSSRASIPRHDASVLFTASGLDTNFNGEPAMGRTFDARDEGSDDAVDSTDYADADDDQDNEDDAGEDDASDEQHAAPLHAPLSEEEYHIVKHVATAAELYGSRQALIGRSLFADIHRWTDMAMDGRNSRLRAIQEETLLMSRQEETAFQIDEVLRRGAELTEEFRQMATLRHHADTAAYRAKEERIEGKRLMLDEKMAALQRDVSLLDRRQTHLAAAQAHNDAKARVQDQREAQLTHHQQDIAARKKKALEQLAALEQRETKVVRWTEILSRREAAIVARETASLRSTKLHHQPPSVDSAVWGARKENPDPRLNPSSSSSSSAAAAAAASGSGDYSAASRQAAPRAPLAFKEELNIGVDDRDDGCI